MKKEAIDATHLALLPPPEFEFDDEGIRAEGRARLSRLFFLAREMSQVTRVIKTRDSKRLLM